MSEEFKYDVFLSYNAKDQPRVRRLAERLRLAGARVWFADWVIKPGDDIYLSIEQGLEAARVQVLCLSTAALESDWVGLERSTVLFRDPSNVRRRFIPLLLEDCDLPATLRRYKYVDFRDESPFAFDELLKTLQASHVSFPASREVPSIRGEDLNDLNKGHSLIGRAGIDPTCLSRERLIHETAISKVVVLHGEPPQRFIFKRTRADLCQLATLQRLADKKEIVGRDGRNAFSVSIGVPLVLWAADGFVFELRHYYDGIPLDELVLRNRFRITAEFLAKFHNGFVRALSELHELGIIHRDVQPRNILVTKGGDLVLLDSTLACEIGSEQIPIDSVYYTAPEQLQRKAAPSSDFYSLGSTEFFIANGFPPGTCSQSKYVTSLQRIYYGTWYPCWEGELPGDLGEAFMFNPGAAFLAGLLAEDEKRRPSKTRDLLLRTITRVTTSLTEDVMAILDAGDDLGFLVCCHTAYGFVENNDMPSFLAKVLAEKGVRAGDRARCESLEGAIRRHLAGFPEWKL